MDVNGGSACAIAVQKSKFDPGYNGIRHVRVCAWLRNLFQCWVLAVMDGEDGPFCLVVFHKVMPGNYHCGTTVRAVREHGQGQGRFGRLAHKRSSTRKKEQPSGCENCVIHRKCTEPIVIVDVCSTYHTTTGTVYVHTVHTVQYRIFGIGPSRSRACMPQCADLWTVVIPLAGGTELKRRLQVFTKVLAFSGNCNCSFLRCPIKGQGADRPRHE
jgi:hypothetical protein